MGYVGESLRNNTRRHSKMQEENSSHNAGSYAIKKLRLNSRIKPRMYVRRSTMFEKAAFC